MRTDELELAQACPRCGRQVPSDTDLAARASRGHVLIRDRRLAVPSQAMDDLRDVAAALRCRAGLCSGEWQERVDATRKKANRGRSEKLAGVPKDDRRPSPEGPRSKKSPAVAAVAEAAGVSPSTVERVQKLEREDPEAFERLASTGEER